jgi:hypothetical protein
VRRDSSTVVVLVGEVGEGLLAELGHSPNVTVVRAPAVTGAESAPASRPGWEQGALAMREAAHRQSPYVIVADDPLAEVAAAWRAMWDTASGAEGAAQFEAAAGTALAAWREKSFELPDYYLMLAGRQEGGASPDMYLGPLRAVRPGRVAADILGRSDGAGRVLDTLRSLPHGPWWPPLDELINAARHFYAGGLTETQPGLAHPAGEL